MKMLRIKPLSFAALLFTFFHTHTIAQTELTADGFYSEGAAAQDRNDFQQAIRFYTAVIDKDTYHAKALFNRALCYIEQGKYYLAAQDFQKYLDIEPNDKAALEMYGNMAFLNGKLDLAIYQYSLLLELETNPVVLLNRALAYFQNKQMEKARVDFENLKTLQPDNALIYNYLGEISAVGDNYELAFENFKKALELDGSDAVILNNYGRYLAKAGNYQEAMTQFDKAIKIAPQSALFTNRALAELEMDNLEKARTDAQTAIDLDFKNAQAYYTMGKIEFQAGNYFEAVEYFKMACDIQPAEPAYFFALGLAHLSRQEKEDANIAFQQVFEMAPDFPELKKYLTK